MKVKEIRKASKVGGRIEGELIIQAKVQRRDKASLHTVNRKTAFS